MKRTMAVVFVFLLVGATVANGARKDDFEFAQGLVEMKYYDLAREQFDAIIGDQSRPAEERANGELGLALLLKAEVMDLKPDPKKKPEDFLGAFRGAEEAFTKFLSTYPSHPRLMDAKFEIGLLLQAKGAFLADLQGKDPENAAKYRKEAEDAYDQAADLFKGAAEAMEQKYATLNEEEQKSEAGLNLDWDKNRARYFEAVANYNKGQLYAPGSAEQAGTLERAVEKLQNFVGSTRRTSSAGTPTSTSGRPAATSASPRMRSRGSPRPSRRRCPVRRPTRRSTSSGRTCISRRTGRCSSTAVTSA
jgi:hypothetical protein